ncbi:hypothetical protein [Campylobacter sp.]|uniref:hypothetical protein n=1 Tax=Campylobacter sp. TaxID=205 RepID=UPI002A802A84|nr:hypothetical protein [Campylobacter sp.]MDY4445154.1 hypothetical protein [Campylobacter sp.]
MLKHNMDIDPSYEELHEKLHSMQDIQITKEVIANEEKEQKIQERQPKTAEELQENKQENVATLEHNLDINQSFQEEQEQLNGIQKIQITQKIVANEEKEQNEDKEFNKWIKNAPTIYQLNENDYSKDQWLEEFRENKKSNPEQNYLIANSQDGQTAQKAIKAYETAIDYLNRRHISPDNAEKHELSVELADKNTIEKIDKKTQKYLNNSDIAISYDEAFNEATFDETKSFKKILKNGLEKQKQKNITAEQYKELNPQEKQELAKNAIKNVNENERFKEYYGLEDELKANQKAQEEKIKEHQKEMDELDKQYGQGRYYKPNWQYYKGNEQSQENQQKQSQTKQEEQENPNKLSPEEEAIRKEYLEKRKELELKQEKEMKKLKNEENSIKAKMNDTTIAITTCGDFEELIKNLKQLDAALIALNKNKEEQIKEEQRQREELINQALKDDPLMQKIVSGMLKKQREKQEELKKEQEEMSLAKEQANYLSKKVDDMQQTNNPNAKKSFAEDIEKALKTIDETKNLEKKQEKTPAEKQKIKEIKKLEEHYEKTIERARKELEKYKKEQVKQQEQTKQQGVTR